MDLDFPAIPGVGIGKIVAFCGVDESYHGKLRFLRIESGHPFRSVGAWVLVRLLLENEETAIGITSSVNKAMRETN